MKRIISNVMLVAAAATAFFSCQKQEVIVPETEQEVMLTFASEKPAFDDETKTEWTGETIQWSKGDKISVAYTVNGTWQNASGDASGDAKLYKSEELAAASATALFNVSTYFKGTTEGTHVFYGVYPAPSETGFADAPVATVTVASSQNPKADSFDPNGDLMVGVSNEYSSRPGEEETISLKWERLVAHAVISLKNINGLTADEKIENITLTAQDGANLVGQQEVNLITKEVVKDNATANVVKLGAGNLSVNDGVLSFWACFLPETITSLTVVVETDKATYTRQISTCNLEFKQNARNTLAIKMDSAVREEKVVASDEVVDVLNRALTGVTGTTYTSWSGKTSVSEAVYAGQSAGGNESIQLRSNNSNSGIVTTVSGGFAKKVVVTWNSNTASGRTLNIYGSHTTYSAPTDLYATDKCGDKLGTIVCGTSTELTIDGEYEYIGLRSNSGAMYVEEIKITWSTGALAPDTTPKLEVAETEIELSAEEAEGTVAVTCKNIEMVEARALVAEGSQEESDWLAADWTDEGVYYIASANESEESRTAVIEIYALDAEGNELVEYIAVTQKGYVDPSVVEKKTIAEFKALADGDTVYELEGRISQIVTPYSSQYNNISFYIVDETTGDEIQIYRMSCVGVTEPATSITVGDRITVRGAKGSYGGQSQMAEGGTYVSHEDGAATPKIVCVDNTVTITADAGAAIYYTTDGQIPTTSSTPYNAEFLITEAKTVKAIAVVDGLLQSLVASVECEYVNPDAPQPISETLNIYGNTGVLGTDVISWTGEYFTCTNEKASSSTAIRNSDSDHYRVYAKSVLTFTAVEDKAFTKVVVTCTSSSYATVLSNSLTSTGATASVSGSVVTITCSTPLSEITFTATAQTRINTVVATLN